MCKGNSMRSPEDILLYPQNSPESVPFYRWQNKGQDMVIMLSLWTSVTEFEKVISYPPSFISAHTPPTMWGLYLHLIDGETSSENKCPETQVSSFSSS